jgi:hypothetical protein
MQTTSYSPSLWIQAYNRGVSAQATETIILDKINVLGFQNFSVSMTCYSGTVTTSSIYASADGVNYYLVHSGGISGLTAGNTAQYTFTSINVYLRITATGISTFDCYLVGDA